MARTPENSFFGCEPQPFAPETITVASSVFDHAATDPRSTTRAMKASTGMTPRFLPPRARTLTVPDCLSLSPTTAMYGSFCRAQLADFIVDLFTAQIFTARADSGGAASWRRTSRAKARLRVGNRGHRHLHRAQPHGHRAGVVLDQHADPALERAQNRAVQHHGHLAGVVFGDVLGAKTPRHLEVDLNRAALPGAAKAVACRWYSIFGP